MTSRNAITASTDNFGAASDFRGDFHATYGLDASDLSDQDTEALREVWIDATNNDWTEAAAVIETELSNRAGTFPDQRVAAYLGHVTDSL